MLPAKIQDWFADRGYGQYALPRSRPRRPRMSSHDVILRLTVGAISLFVLPFIVLFIAAIVIFAYGAIFGA